MEKIYVRRLEEITSTAIFGSLLSAIIGLAYKSQSLPEFLFSLLMFLFGFNNRTA